MEDSIKDLTSKLEEIASLNMQLEDDKLFISNELSASQDENIILKNFNTKIEADIKLKADEILAYFFLIFFFNFSLYELSLMLLIILVTNP